MDFLDRLSTYDKSHCWQYQIRLDNLNEDIKQLPPNVDYKDIRIDDFTFKLLETREEKLLAVDFIKRHEWLGTMTMYTTHYFGAYYHNILAGVITMSVPNSFSKLLGDNTSNLERLISRGACISWSPKGLASKFLMWCIRYMVNNTQFRVFTAYSDPSAKELGTIYQACNFYYIGNNFGTTTRYISPYTGKLVSDRAFRQKSFYKKYATELGIVWEQDWCNEKGRIDWDKIPNEVERLLRKMSRDKQQNAKSLTFLPKHKYVYVLGRDNKETKRLRKALLANVDVFPYPKERGK